MEQITLYEIFDEEGNRSFTREPQLKTNSSIYYRLTANKGCSMRNIKTNEKLKVAIVPEYQLSRWVEESYK